MTTIVLAGRSILEHCNAQGGRYAVPARARALALIRVARKMRSSRAVEKVKDFERRASLHVQHDTKFTSKRARGYRLGNHEQLKRLPNLRQGRGAVGVTVTKRCLCLASYSRDE